MKELNFRCIEHPPQTTQFSSFEQIIWSDAQVEDKLQEYAVVTHSHTQTCSRHVFDLVSRLIITGVISGWHKFTYVHIHTIFIIFTHTGSLLNVLYTYGQPAMYSYVLSVGCIDCLLFHPQCADYASEIKQSISVLQGNAAYVV